MYASAVPFETSSVSVVTCNSGVILQSVNRLVMDTRRIVKGNHSRKTAAYVRVSDAAPAATTVSIVCLYNTIQYDNIYFNFHTCQ